MKLKTAIALAGLAAITAYATGVQQDWIPAISECHTLSLHRAGGSYNVSGLGVSNRTKAAIINKKVITKGEEVDSGLVLNDVEMDSFSITAANVEVTVSH